jgi:nitrogen fixation protein NifB
MSKIKYTSNEIHYEPKIQALIDQHPCYSSKGSRKLARIHLPVAAGCNTQCGYCNRKYDCVNESRPGVTSRLLTPKEAVELVGRVVKKMPQVSVVGIAGPGDPLANPEATLGTLKAVQHAYPHLKLCLSTNGLTLPDYVNDLVALKVEYVTITMNTIDPLTAMRIYSWVRWGGQRLTGMAAAEKLLERQQTGLQQLAARGVLVKVNSVLLPGINDTEMTAIAHKARDLGANLLNIMPLVRSPGSIFEDMPPVTNAQLEQARNECASILPLMRHCQQCRADAIGFLGDDRSAEYLTPRETKKHCGCGKTTTKEKCCA